MNPATSSKLTNVDFYNELLQFILNNRKDSGAFQNWPNGAILVSVAESAMCKMSVISRDETGKLNGILVAKTTSTNSKCLHISQMLATSSQATHDMVWRLYHDHYPTYDSISFYRRGKLKVVTADKLSKFLWRLTQTSYSALLTQ